VPTSKLKPREIIETLNLRRPIYRKTAAYGHFGRNDRISPGKRPTRPRNWPPTPGLKKNEPVEPGSKVQLGALFVVRCSFFGLSERRRARSEQRSTKLMKTQSSRN